MATVFLHGFNGESTFIGFIAENIFPVRIESIMTTWVYETRPLPEDIYSISGIIIASLILYGVSAFLYRKRRLETAEDVAGFNCLNYIFKYLVTLMGALGAFAIFSPLIYSSPAAVWLLVTLLSMLIYFAAEMILKKSFRVWGCYRGYIGFALVFAGIVSIFAFTDFFGYESRIPHIDRVKSATVYEYYSYDEPFVKDRETIEKIIKLHEKMVEDKEIVDKKKNNGETTNIHIKYNLENGKSLSRVYSIKSEEMRKIMNEMYEYDAYKMEREVVFLLDDSIQYIVISGTDEKIYEEEKVKEILGCIKSDVLSLSYDEIHNDGWSFNLDIAYEKARNAAQEEMAMDTGTRIYHDPLEINANYKNTINWIKENGYWESVSLKNEGMMFISRSEYADFVFDGDDYSQIPEVKNGEIILLEDAAEIQKLIDYIHTNGQEYIPYESAYHIFIVKNIDYQRNIRIMSISGKEVKKLFPYKIGDNFIDKAKP